MSRDHARSTARRRGRTRDGEPGTFTYSRFSGPTLVEAEARLGALDGGEALLFSSGIAACTSVVLALLSPGQTVAIAAGGYYGTGVMLDELARWGVERVEFDQTGSPPDGVDLVWLEAPSNPFLTMPNFEAAAAHPARVVCDSTAATPLYVRPLDLGCDIAVHSATKFLAGHDDALVGAVVCKREEDAARLLAFRSQRARSQPQTQRGCCFAGSRRSRSASRVRRRARRPSRRASMAIPLYGSSATRDSAACSRSTSTTPRPLDASRPRRG